MRTDSIGQIDSCSDDFVQGFDDLLNLEQVYVQVGHQLGSASARQSLIDSARAHGRTVSRRLAFEPGYYHGFALVVADLAQRGLLRPEPRAMRALRQLQQSLQSVQESLTSFDDDQQLPGRLRLLRARFRILVRALGLHERLQVATSTATAAVGF